MHIDKHILAVDMGTTAFKASVFNTRGEELGSETVEYTLQTPKPGWAEASAELYITTFRKAASAAMAAAGIGGHELAALGLSCQCETTLFLDAQDQTLRDAIVWLDNRATSEASEIVKAFGSDDIQSRTGQVGEDAIWPGAKLLWIRENEPEVFRNLSSILQLNSYIAYKLTGSKFAEDSMLGSSIYWDLNTRDYWQEMLDYIGISRDQLPQICEPGSIVGTITADAASFFGLPAGLPVSIGATDLACGCIGTGNIRPGDFSDSTGSSLCTMTLVDHLIKDPVKQMPCYCSATPGIYMIHAYSNGGMFMRWFRDEFCKLEISREAETGLNAFDQLDEIASHIAPGCDGLIALPHLQGSGPPDLNPNARATFYGLTLAHTKGHFARAIMESVTMVLRRIIEATEALDVKVDRIISLGGGAHSSLWCQIKADATGRTIAVTQGHESACCLGAAVLAGVAVGVWNDLEDACEKVIKESIVYTPDPANKAAYDKLYEDYKKLLECLKPMNS